jgi:hypothetical protein
MLLHFIFVIKEKDLGKRNKEFDYIKQMSQFYKQWIKNNFLIEYDVKCDEMITKPNSLFQRLDTYQLLKDHRERGEDIYHFYLTHFRPLWTDCTCEGYHAENFGMTLWETPKTDDDILFLAEKNCSTVSHEIAHEMLRKSKNKKYVDIVHDVWTRHLFDKLPFEQYGRDFHKTTSKPYFLTIDTSGFQL